MEDAKSICLKLNDRHKDLAFFGVYDGHAGSQCSRYLEKAVPAAVGKLANPTKKHDLVDAMLTVDEEFLSKPHGRTNGSTCVFTVVRPRRMHPHKSSDGSSSAKSTGGSSSSSSSSSSTSGQQKKPSSPDKKLFEVTVSNIGDSRAVLLRADGRWKLLTRDHKPSNPEEQERIEKAEGKVDNGRVDGQLALSRAMGDWHYKQNGKLKPHQQKVVAIPEVSRILAAEGDTLLLCCDGIFEKLTTAEVCRFVHEDMTVSGNKEPALTLARLLDLSLDRGSKDNMTAVCITFKDGSDYGQVGNELIPGRYFEYSKDEKFNTAYLKFAKSHGFEGEALFSKIPKQMRQRVDISPREREFSSVLSQLKDSDRSLLMAMVANTGEEKEASNDGRENSDTAPI